MCKTISFNQWKRRAHKLFLTGCLYRQVAFVLDKLSFCPSQCLDENVRIVLVCLHLWRSRRSENLESTNSVWKKQDLWLWVTVGCTTTKTNDYLRTRCRIQGNIKLFGSHGCSDEENGLDFLSIFFKNCWFCSSILLLL